MSKNREAIRLNLYNEVSNDVLLKELERLMSKQKRIEKMVNEDLERTNEKINSIQLYLNYSHSSAHENFPFLYKVGTTTGSTGMGSDTGSTGMGSYTGSISSSESEVNRV